jgi:hypothetical protein
MEGVSTLSSISVCLGVTVLRGDRCLCFLRGLEWTGLEMGLEKVLETMLEMALESSSKVKLRGLAARAMVDSFVCSIRELVEVETPLLFTT